MGVGEWWGGGGLLACTSSNPRLLTLSAQSSPDRQRWYFIILVPSVFSDSIITLHISFSGASLPLALSLSPFFLNYISNPLRDRISLPSILAAAILNLLALLLFFILGLSFNQRAVNSLFGILSGIGS